MATRVFGDQELEALRKFPEIGREELFRFFTLTPADIAFVDPSRGRGPADRLGLAVALCTLPWLGFVPDKVAAAPRAAVARLAEQLHVDPDQIRFYGRRAKTRTEHLRLVSQYLGWRAPTTLELKELDEFLLARALEHDEDEQAMLLRWAAVLGAPTEVTQGRLAAPARSATDWIARRFGLDSALVRLLVSTFCQEVHCYLSDPTRRYAARTTVAEAITVVAPAVVIAHSLGSVITYETLWAHPELHIDLLITLGSPLAMPDVVFDKLHPAPERGKGHRPPGVRRWINIADPGDIIATPRHLDRLFVGIDADLTTPIGVFDFHKVTGYLSCTTTAAALATLL